jgi:hypothetical protein
MSQRRLKLSTRTVLDIGSTRERAILALMDAGRLGDCEPEIQLYKALTKSSRSLSRSRSARQ